MNDVSVKSPLQSSTAQQVAEIMAVPTKPGYVDAFVKIVSTIAREAFAMDKQDWTLLVAQYTEDAVFETSADFGILPEEVRKLLDRGVRGHAAIVEYVKIAGGFAFLPAGMWNQHVYTNFWLEKYDGRTALARGYVAGLGRIEQEYRLCTDDTWRITRKKIIANSFPPRQATMPVEWTNPAK